MPSSFPFEFSNFTVPGGGTKATSVDGDGDGVSTEGTGVGVLAFVFSTGRTGFLSEAIWSSFGFTTKKNKPAKAPPLSRRKISTPAMMYGIFDFFFATGGGNGADGAGADTGGGGCGVTTSPVVRCCGCSTTGGGGGGGVGVTGGGGGGDAGGAGREMSEVFGAVELVVGPVLRGNATVAG